MKTVNFEVKTNKTVFWREVAVTNFYYENGHPDYESLDSNGRNEDYGILHDFKKDLGEGEEIVSFKII